MKNLTTGEQQPVKTAEVAQAVRGFLKPEGGPHSLGGGGKAAWESRHPNGWRVGG